MNHADVTQDERWCNRRREAGSKTLGYQTYTTLIKLVFSRANDGMRPPETPPRFQAEEPRWHILPLLWGSAF